MMLLFSIFLSLVGILFSLIANHNIKKIIALNIAQSGIILTFLIIGFEPSGHPPVLIDNISIYSNPLIHTLMLTAIVVSASTSFLLTSLHYD